MKNISILSIFFVVVIFSCKFTPFPGYSRIKPDLYFNLIEMGDGTKTAETGNYLTVNMVYSTMEDSMFFKGIRKIKLEKDLNNSLFSDAVQLMGRGDSASIILDAESYLKNSMNIDIPDFLAGEERMKINLRIIEVQTEAQFETEKELFLSWVKEFKSSEYQNIQNYLKTNQINAEPEPNGIYFLSHTKGQGPPVEKGKRISIHYEGMFLNGKFFDSTVKREAPLDFIYGKEMVIIDGLDYALGKMNEGGEAMVLLPSEFGFGRSGSAGGIVPPYSALIYEIEVIKVD